MTATRRTVAIAIVAAFLGAALIGLNLFTARRLIGYVSGTPYADVFTRLDDPLDILFGLGDGQASIAIARDPTLSNLALFRGVRGEAALRAQRPLQGYLGWIFSLGHPSWAEEGVVLATILGCAVATAGCAELLRQRRQNPWLALLVLELPGSLAAIRQFGPELLGLGLIIFGIIARRDGRVRVSVLLFVAAGLARETYLLVPLLYTWRDRRYLVPHIAWLCWTGVVWLRFGAFAPTVKLEGTRLLVAPFLGVVKAFASLHFPLLTVLLIVLTPALAIAVALKRRSDELTPVVIAYGMLAIFLNPVVWSWWASFTRVLLPMTAFALIALSATPAGASSRSRQDFGHTAGSPMERWG